MAAKQSSKQRAFAVYLGLDRDLLAAQGLAHPVFLSSSWDADEAWQASQSGDWDSAALSVTDYTHVEVLTAAAPWDYQNMWGTGGDLAGYHDRWPPRRATRSRRWDRLTSVVASCAVRLSGGRDPRASHPLVFDPGQETTRRSTSPARIPPAAELRDRGRWPAVTHPFACAEPAQSGAGQYDDGSPTQDSRQRQGRARPSL